MDRITLYHYESPQIKVTVKAYFKDEWLMVEGYDVGEKVEEIRGDSDYEYVTGVKGDDLLKLYELLNVQEGDQESLLRALAARFNTNYCYSQFQDLLNSNGIRAESFSW